MTDQEQVAADLAEFDKALEAAAPTRIDLVHGEDGALKLDVPDFVCPACGHTAPYGNPHADVLRCSECESRIAYGVPMPRVVVEPCGDRRFVKLRFESWDKGVKAWRAVYEAVVDRGYGLAIWHNVQSICQ